MKQFDTVQNNEWIPETADIATAVQIVSVLPAACRELEGITYLLSGTMQNYTCSHFYKCVQDTDLTYKWQDLLVGRYSLGNCKDIKIGVIEATSGASADVILAWKDPDDVTIGTDVLRWSETKIVYQLGHMPADLADGVIIGASTERDQYQSFGSFRFTIPRNIGDKSVYVKLFPISHEGAVTNDDANGRCSWSNYAGGENYLPTSDIQPDLDYSAADPEHSWKYYYAKNETGTGWTKLAYNTTNYDGTGISTDPWKFKDNIVYYERFSASINWEGVQLIVKAGYGEMYFPIGTVFQLPYHHDFGDMAYVVVDHNNVQLADTSVKYSMTLMAKYAYRWWDSDLEIPFDGLQYVGVATRDTSAQAKKNYYRAIACHGSSTSTLVNSVVDSLNVKYGAAWRVAEYMKEAQTNCVLFIESNVDMTSRAGFSGTTTDFKECEYDYITRWGHEYTAGVGTTGAIAVPQRSLEAVLRNAAYVKTSDTSRVAGKTYYVYNSSDETYQVSSSTSMGSLYELMGFSEVVANGVNTFQYGYNYYKRSGDGTDASPYRWAKQDIVYGTVIPVPGVGESKWYVSQSLIHSYGLNEGDEYSGTTKEQGASPLIQNSSMPYEPMCLPDMTDSQPNRRRFIPVPYITGYRRRQDYVKYFCPAELSISRYFEDGKWHTVRRMNLRDCTTDISAADTYVKTMWDSNNAYYWFYSGEWDNTSSTTKYYNFDLTRALTGCYDQVYYGTSYGGTSGKAVGYDRAPMTLMATQDEVFLPGKRYFKTKYEQVKSGTKWNARFKFFRKSAESFVPTPGSGSAIDMFYRVAYGKTGTDVKDYANLFIQYANHMTTDGGTSLSQPMYPVATWAEWKALPDTNPADTSIITRSRAYVVGSPIPTITQHPVWCKKIDLTKTNPETDTYWWSCDGGLTECTKDFLGNCPQDAGYTGYKADSIRVTEISEPIIQRYFRPMADDEVMALTQKQILTQTGEQDYKQVYMVRTGTNPLSYTYKALTYNASVDPSYNSSATGYVCGTYESTSKTVAQWKEDTGCTGTVCVCCEVNNLYWKVPNTQNGVIGDCNWATSNLRQYLNGPFEDGISIGAKTDTTVFAKYWNYGVSPIQQYVYDSVTQAWVGNFADGEYWYTRQASPFNALVYDRLDPRFATNYIKQGNAASSTYQLGNPGYARAGEGYASDVNQKKFGVNCRAQLPRQSFLHGFLDCQYKRSNDLTKVPDKTYYFKTPYGFYEKLEEGDEFCATPYAHCLYEINEGYRMDYLEAAAFLKSIQKVVNHNGMYGNENFLDSHPQNKFYPITDRGTTTIDKVWLGSKMQFQGTNYQAQVGGVIENNSILDMWHYKASTDKTVIPVTSTILNDRRKRAAYSLGRHTASGYKDACGASISSCVVVPWWSRTIHDANYDSEGKVEATDYTDPNTLKVATVNTDGTFNVSSWDDGASVNAVDECGLCPLITIG